MEPKDFARVILRRKRTVLAATAIVAVTAVLGSLRKPPQYVAECHVLFQATTGGAETIGSLASNAQLIQGPSVAADVAKRLDVDPRTLPGVNVEIIPETQIFRLQVADYDSQRAADVCNATGRAFSAFKRSQARDQFRSQLSQVEVALEETYKQYDEITQELGEAERREEEGRVRDLLVQRDALALERATLRRDYASVTNLLRAGVEGGGELITPSDGGRSLKAGLKRDLLLGLIVGLMFGLGIALVREYLDDTLKDKESTQRDLGLPVLAALPPEDLDGFVEASSPTVEAARGLRAALASLGFPHQKRVLLITSTLAKARSTTLASLAAAVAESGRTVLVVGSDLRGGRTHEAFGVANTVGLVNVVRGQVPMDRAIRPAPGLDGVFVLPAGPLVANPGELLSSEEMAFALRRARRWADVLLLDAPPVLAAADASILGAYADGVLLVLSAGRTNRAQATEAKEQLRSAGATVLGAVLVGTEEQAARGANGYTTDHLPHLVPYDGWGDAYAEWDEDGVLRATARTVPRSPNGNGGRKKKVSAAKVGARAPRRTTAAAPKKPAPKKPAPKRTSPTRTTHRTKGSGRRTR